LILTTPFEFAIWGNDTEFKPCKRFGPAGVRSTAPARQRHPARACATAIGRGSADGAARAKFEGML
ncbi:hypothetical protein, partial [Ralstonia solanacearum species complex bacterium KE055]|uniref:hypothetical protein n=1 Tax=Ralstonia solanacearum species complex bacterium KE055 TaxID=3119586 RepID=UPI002FC36EBF